MLKGNRTSVNGLSLPDLAGVVKEAVGLDIVGYHMRYVLLPSRLTPAQLLYHIIGENTQQLLMVALEVDHKATRPQVLKQRPEYI